MILLNYSYISLYVHNHYIIISESMSKKTLPNSAQTVPVFGEVLEIRGAKLSETHPRRCPWQNIEKCQVHMYEYIYI